MSSRRELHKNRPSGFNIPMNEADKAGYGGEPIPDLPTETLMPRASIAKQLQEEKMVLEKELEDLRQQLESRTNAMTVHNGTLIVHDFQLTSKGLIAPQDMDKDSWQQVGNLLFKLEGSLQWLIGDWLDYGEAQDYGDTKALAEAMGRDPQTLYNYRNVARSVRIDLRKENLTFNHHALVSGKSIEEQARALEYASEHDLSVAQMRKWLQNNETVEIEHISDYKATPPEARRGLFQQYVRDIARFNPDEPDSFDDMNPNDLFEIGRRAEWLMEYYKTLGSVTMGKWRRKKKK